MVPEFLSLILHVATTHAKPGVKTEQDTTSAVQGKVGSLLRQAGCSLTADPSSHFEPHQHKVFPQARHLFEPRRLHCFVVGGLSGEWDKMIELQRKAEKYEGKVAQCRDWAKQAAEGPQRAFFETLADYYEGLAADFRQAIAKRTAA